MHANDISIYDHACIRVLYMSVVVMYISFVRINIFIARYAEDDGNIDAEEFALSHLQLHTPKSEDLTRSAVDRPINIQAITHLLLSTCKAISFVFKEIYTCALVDGGIRSKVFESCCLLKVIWSRYCMDIFGSINYIWSTLSRL